MKFFTIIFSVSALLFFANTSVEAKDEAIVSVTQTTKDTPLTPIAMVNIEKGAIVSQQDHILNASFTLTNKKDIQVGVRYGIQLIKENAKKQSIADYKMYDEAITLVEGASIPKEIVYTAPATLSGEYTVLIISGNKDGFPFGTAMIGKVTFPSGEKGLQIIPGSCASSATQVNPDEQVSVSCTVQNTTEAPITATPVVSVYEGAIYGTRAPGVASNKDVIVAPGESIITLTLPVQKNPQAYTASLALSYNGAQSNSSIVSYAVKGNKGSLSNVTLDKDYYAKGDNATVSVVWLSTAQHVSIEGTIVSSNGRMCSTSFNKAFFRQDDGVHVSIVVPIIKDCKNPQVNVTLKNQMGVVLDTNVFTFTSGETNIPATKSSQIFVVGGVLALLLGIGFFLKKRKNNSYQE